MSFRLYESAWVQVDGADLPLQVHKNPANPAAFDVGGFQYDIDARPLAKASDAPRIVSILSIQAAREAGLRSHYGEGSDAARKPSR